jgi:hypothetical protein
MLLCNAARIIPRKGHAVKSLQAPTPHFIADNVGRQFASCILAGDGMRHAIKYLQTEGGVTSVLTLISFDCPADNVG